MLINVLSGVWFYPITTLFNKSRKAQLDDIKQLQLEYGFSKIINLDDELRFWWVGNNEYNKDIQTKLDIKKLHTMEKKFKTYIKLIKNISLNTPNNSILFISINSTECMYALHLYIYLKYCGISKDNRNLALSVVEIIKNKYSFQIKLDEKLKTLLF
jgi:hypothetical protein